MKDLSIKNNDIELVQSKEPRIDSRLVAKEMGITHKSLMNLIRSNKNDLKEFGSLPFQKASRKRGVGAVTITYVLLNENQFDLISRIARGKNHKQIIDFKVRVTKAFANSREREKVKREYLPFYHQSRDALSMMQGVKKYHYINLAKAENRFTGLYSGERQTANEQQLGALIILQQIESAVFNEIDTPTEAIREVGRRINALSDLIATNKTINNLRTR